MTDRALPQYLQNKYVLLPFIGAVAGAILLSAVFFADEAHADFVMPSGIQEGDLIRGPDGILVWVVNERGYRRHIFNPEIFNLYGHLRWENIKEVDRATLDAFTPSDLYRVAGDFRISSVGEVSEGEGIALRYWLDMSAGSFIDNGYRWEQVFTINQQEHDFYRSGGPVSVSKPNATLATFRACTDLETALEENKNRLGNYGYFTRDVGIAAMPQPLSEMEAQAPAPGLGAPADYSRTNVQVEGVDEADIVKTDGSYLYIISNNRIIIAEAVPPESARVLSTIDFSDSNPSELFIHGNYLLAFGQQFIDNVVLPGPITTEPSVRSSVILPSYSSISFMKLYDISDRANPTLQRTIEFDGSYLTSRKIDNVAYAVFNSYPDYRYFEPMPLEGGIDKADPAAFLPRYRDLRGPETGEGTEEFSELVGCDGVAYIPPIIDNQYLTVVGLAMDDPSAELHREVILGAGSQVYASAENLYVANPHYNYYPLLSWDPSMAEPSEVLPPQEETVIQKFALYKGEVIYQEEARLPGVVLNQFSMDEFNGYFRIVTSIGSSWGTVGRSNAAYVLDAALEQVGAIENIAPGEQLYSVRFMGERGYLVTFLTTDPFFVADLSDPRNPEIVGELKIPGYSDYLHPYDENHIIGVGKNAIGDESGTFAWYQGMKIALFDVTDPANPVQMHTVDIGDRGTDSPVLRDHKAFLFSRDRNLLVLPVLLAEIPESEKASEQDPFAYGSYTFQGSYIYALTLENGFELRGRVTHHDTDSPVFYGDSDILRNLYIDANLYSLSNAKVLIHNLTDLRKVGEINFPN